MAIGHVGLHCGARLLGSLSLSGSVALSAICGCGGKDEPYEVPAIARLAGKPSALAVDEDHIFVTSRARHPDSTGFVERVPKQGGAAETIAATEAPNVAIALDDANVYFTGYRGGPPDYRGGPYVANKSGGGATLLGPSQSAICWGSCWGVAVDGERAYWTEWFGVDGFVHSMPKDGSSFSTVLADDPGLPLRLVIDDTRVYWGNQEGEVWAVSKLGGDPVRLAAASALADFLTVDDAFVYFTSGGQQAGIGRVNRVSKQGGETEVLTETDDLFPPTGLAVARGRVYVGTREGIRSFRIDGSNPELIEGTKSVGNDIETDGDAIYWVSGGEQEPPGAVYRLAIRG